MERLGGVCQSYQASREPALSFSPCRADDGQMRFRMSRWKEATRCEDVLAARWVAMGTTINNEAPSPAATALPSRGMGVYARGLFERERQWSGGSHVPR